MEYLIEKDVWENCYETGWRKLIVPDAFSHPAKFSYNLIERIYTHSIDNGWIRRGDLVLDPFGGVALGGLGAIMRGMNWIGVELEEKFVKIGEKNINRWKEEENNQASAGMKRDLGTAKIIQGDSRKLKFHLAKFIGTPDMMISSPPYADSLSGSDKPQDHNRHQELATKAGHGRIGGGQLVYQNAYGRTLGNLSNMKEGDIDLVVSSPPFSVRQPTSDARPGEDIELKDMPVDSYGQTPGQLGLMKEGDLDLAVSYDTFWSVSREIVQECYDLLKLEGHAIWVTKDYVKDGKRVQFSDRWATLCESVGFKVLCRHHATLITKGQDGWVENQHKVTKERKSFFRRLQESRGSPKIDWEDVVCMVK